MAKPTLYFSVRNFEKFQHYKERNPPWIKLYASILDDFEFNQLTETSRWHLVGLWIVASRMQNRMPFDSDWIRKRINAGKSFNLQLFVDKGFLIVEQDASTMLDASKTLAECKQNADSETETEERQRQIKENIQKKKYGIGENVKLSQEEFDKLKSQFGEEGTNNRIDNLSTYIGSHGDGYKSHYLTILNWERKNNQPEPKKERKLVL